MRITALNLQKEYTQDWGLGAINMPRLGRIVALAGKNGSGKSRILDAIEQANRKRTEIVQSYSETLEYKGGLEENIAGNPNHGYRLRWEQEILDLNDRLAWIDRVQVDKMEVARAIRFVPKNLGFDDPLGLRPRDHLERYESAKSIDVSSHMAGACLSYIQQRQNRYWTATHQNFQGVENERIEAASEYEALQELVSALIGVELARSINDAAQIFGKDIFEARLSDGQKVLLQLAVALHAQKANIGDCFLILDEPENHLHPSVAIDVLEKIFQVAPDSQLWIATHSVPLLAYVVSKEPMALWYVSDGVVAHAGRNPKLVLDSLLGGEDRIGQLHAFTSLPAQLAAINYAAESLVSPQVVPYGGADPQVNQIHRALAELSSGRAIRMLDFGAGKGRLLEGLAALEANEFATKVDYFALDGSAADADACKGVIKHFYRDDRPRHFLSVDEVLDQLTPSFFDVVVMCNVLHEISPAGWGGLFSAESALLRSIATNGYMLIVEDMRIPTGEKAHEYGFLVLDTQHLKILFGVTEDDVRGGRFIVNDARGDGRLKANLISRGLLERMSGETRRQAIQALADTAYRKIQDVRSRPAIYSNGMLHGFWTQQFANASIYLRSV